MTSEKSTSKGQNAKGKAKRTANASDELRSSEGQEDANATQGEKVKHPGGRPSEFTQHKADEFCFRVGLGRTVRSVCNDGDMPEASTIYRWIEAHPEFRKQYARAKEIHCDAIAEGCFEIADTTNADDVCDEYGNIKPNHEWIARSKVRIDWRKWYLSKIMPKKYGDKLEQTVVGDPEKPVHIKAEIDVKAMTPEQLKDFIRAETHGQK